MMNWGHFYRESQLKPGEWLYARDMVKGAKLSRLKSVLRKAGLEADLRPTEDLNVVQVFVRIRNN